VSSPTRSTSLALRVCALFIILAVALTLSVWPGALNLSADSLPAAANQVTPTETPAYQLYLPVVWRIMPPACPARLFPVDNIWNTSVDGLPLDPHSQDYVNSSNPSAGMHADFGSGTWDGGPIGIPLVIVPGSQPKVPIASFTYADESDPGPYPIPLDVPIEAGSDHHALIVNQDECRLYELYGLQNVNGKWEAGSGAIWDLRSNGLRPDTWTSADAAGLPILPGLVRYDEAASGEIRHALRFTLAVTRQAHVWPARHDASSNTSVTRPPMGQRFRLRAGFDITGFSPINRAILTALKTYGMILADNGSNWYLSGAPDERWDNDDLHVLQARIHGSDFEAVDESGLQVSVDSGQARQGGE
jgi:hypothetical protein